MIQVLQLVCVHVYPIGVVFLVGIGAGWNGAVDKFDKSANINMGAVIIVALVWPFLVLRDVVDGLFKRMGWR